MLTIETTGKFDKWLAALLDKRARACIHARIDRLEHSGTFGDSKPVGNGIIEMRIHVGPGYRLYCARYDSVVVMMLCGGDKSTQHRDIAAANRLVRQLKESYEQ